MAERILDEGNRTLLLSVGKPTGEYRYQYTKVMDVLTLFFWYNPNNSVKKRLANASDKKVWVQYAKAHMNVHNQGGTASNTLVPVF